MHNNLTVQFADGQPKGKRADYEPPTVQPARLEAVINGGTGDSKDAGDLAFDPETGPPHP